HTEPPVPLPAPDPLGRGSPTLRVLSAPCADGVVTDVTNRSPVPRSSCASATPGARLPARERATRCILAPAAEEDAVLTGAELAVAVALGLAFAPALASLARVWSSTDYLSHGFLVPLVSAWIAWATRARRATLPRRRDPRGAVLIALALALYAAG